MAEYITCEECHRVLRVEDGPVCESCLHERRSEAAKRGAETRKEQSEDETPSETK